MFALLAPGRRLRFVHLSSEQTLEPVHKDCSFAEKQQCQPARLLVVRSGRDPEDGRECRNHGKRQCGDRLGGLLASEWGGVTTLKASVATLADFADPKSCSRDIRRPILGHASAARGFDERSPRGRS